MKHQRGVTLSSLLFWGIIFSAISILAIKVVPHEIEYFKVRKTIVTVAKQSDAESSVYDIRKSLERYFNIEGLNVPLEVVSIDRQGGRLVLSFSYDREVPLFGHASLLLQFRGTSAAQ